MSFFKKKKENIDNRKHVELVFDEFDKNALAFGLQWRSIVTNNAREAGINLARTNGSTHILFRGQQVGFGVIDSSAYPQLTSSIPIYPAAQVVARQYGGNAIFIVNIGLGEYWIAIIRSGSPTSTDTLLLNSDESAALAEASKLLEGLQDESSQLSIYTNIVDHGFPVATKQVSVEEILFAASNDDDRFLTVPKKNVVTIPPSVLIVMIAGLAIISGQYGYHWWEQKKQSAIAFKEAMSKEDPEIIWKRTIVEWESSKVIPSFNGVRQAREDFGKLLVNWDGWILKTAKCNAISTLSGKVRPWSCSATYDRPFGASLNKEMIKKIPEGWNASFSQLKGMQVSWNFSEPVESLHIADFKPVSDYGIQLASQLQLLTPLFSQEIKFDFVPVDIPAPKDSSGSVLPVSPIVADMRQARLKLMGPLRNIDVLIDRDIRADWDSISMTVSSSGSSPTVNSSMFPVEITGVIYAKK